jgi:hypothetical protein
MRKLIAVLLLFCVGLLTLTAASPTRICLIEMGLVSVAEDSECCPDCDRDEEQPSSCCIDLEELPEAIAPESPSELPNALLVENPAELTVALMPLASWHRTFFVSEPIRGPTSPAAYRAVLGIWSI